MSRLESMIAANFLTGKLPEYQGEVSEKFLKGARKAIDLYRGWGWNGNVDLSGFTPVKHKVGGDKVGSFFTLGVDSFYTLLRNEDIEDIIYIYGFEKKLSRDVLEQIENRIEQVAKLFDKKAVFWTSHIRSYLDKHANWPKYSHGPALAAEGLLRENIYKKLYIPASFHDPAIAFGSHPTTDPLWSTESLEFVHDGLLSRTEKIKYIASKSSFAMDKLRVCFQGKEYNCCDCKKCARTIISLNLLGLQSAAFKKRPSLKKISQFAQEERDKPTWALWMQNINEAQKLIKALKGEL